MAFERVSGLCRSTYGSGSKLKPSRLEAHRIMLFWITSAVLGGSALEHGLRYSLRNVQSAALRTGL